MCFLFWLQLELQGREVLWVKGHEEPAALPSVLKSCAAERHTQVEVRQGALGEEVEPLCWLLLSVLPFFSCFSSAVPEAEAKTVIQGNVSPSLPPRALVLLSLKAGVPSHPSSI